jgi:hypothetical protein
MEGLGVKYRALGIFSALFGVPVALAVGCGGGAAAGALGTDCDPKAADACAKDLVCSKSGDKNICTYEPGATCDPEASDVANEGCPQTTTCVTEEVASGAGGAGGASAVSRCLLSEGESCKDFEDACSTGLTCAETTKGEMRCFGKVLFRGMVFDATDAAPIEGGHVMALNDEGYAISNFAATDAGGLYELEVPVKRNEDGTPVDENFTLRGEAVDYQEFPSGIRVALPIAVKDAVQEEKSRAFVVKSKLTDISLIPLPAAERYAASGSIRGLTADSAIAGALVVLSGPEGTFTSVADLSGHFTVFNVPSGTYTLTTYAAGLQVESRQVTVDGANLTKLVIDEVESEFATVSGNIQIVNAPGGSLTSVILVLEDTFDENAARGVVPRGLRAPKSGPVSISGDFSISDVPVGKYVVLAAYENDDLVRDPDTNISGTGFVHVEVKAGQASVVLPDSFKVTQALAVASPGKDGPELVTDKPILVWADDSSEDWYDIHVFDAFGTEVWSTLKLPGQSGKGNVELQYAGPLDPGMYYQFRVSSWRQPGGGDPAPISMTEDLRGVFFTETP